MKHPLRIEESKADGASSDRLPGGASPGQALSCGGLRDGPGQRARLAARRAAERLPVFHSAYIVDSAARPAAAISSGHGRRHARPSVTPASPVTEICAEVAPSSGEFVVIKTEASAFGKAICLPALRASAIEWLFIAGVWTEACVAAIVTRCDRGWVAGASRQGCVRQRHARRCTRRRSSISLTGSMAGR